MKTTKKLGIWMDHSIAYLMEPINNGIITTTVEAQAFSPVKEDNLSSHESLLHHKEHNQLADYFKQLAIVIREYDQVLLFGPTGANKELFNHLRENHLFDKIKIELKQEDKMTENQQEAFVKKYFNIAN